MIKRARSEKRRRRSVEDQTLAEQLQHIEADAAAKNAMKRTKRHSEERGKMLNSSNGKPSLPYKKSLPSAKCHGQIYQRQPSSPTALRWTVAMDDMVFMAKKRTDRIESAVHFVHLSWTSLTPDQSNWNIEWTKWTALELHYTGTNEIESAIQFVHLYWTSSHRTNQIETLKWT